MRYFLTYIDILGFAERAEHDSKESSLEPEEVRRTYIDRIESRLRDLKGRKVIVYFCRMSPDSWLLFSDSIWKSFRMIDEVLAAKLPLEIAIGVKNYVESPAGEELMDLRGETISYIKTCVKDGILSKYASRMKDNGKRVQATFILLTQEAYNVLDRKNLCYKFDPFDFYVVKYEEFQNKMKVLRLLEMIGSERVEYREIEDLYVKPREYDEIERILDRHNLVFIIGDAEIGKTYTAIKLLLEFYSEGYEPLYLSEENRMEQWEFVRHKPHLDGRAVYLEDPWGRVEFKAPESFSPAIADLIKEIKNTHCKVIITSREEVFKESERTLEIVDGLQKYVSSLKVNLSYDRDDLKSILERYLEVFQPAWLSHEELKQKVFQAIGKELKTPMSIRSLIINTRNVTDLGQLVAGIKEAGEATKLVFAREIKEIYNRGEYDKLVFLCFPYIIGTNLEDARLCYWDVLGELRYDSIKAKEFKDLLEEFKTKVEVMTFGSYATLAYIHESYWDAFNYALVDRGAPNNICKKILSKVLVKLSKKFENSLPVAVTLARGFDKLPKDVTNLLYNLSENDETSLAAVVAVIWGFENLPEKVRNELLIKLSEKGRAACHVPFALVYYYNKLPLNVRDLLFELSERNKETAEAVALNVADHFDSLPDSVRNILYKLSDKDETAWGVASAVAYSFDKLPIETRNELLRKLSKRDNATWGVAEAISLNFDRVPKELQTIFFELADRDATAGDVARALADVFERLPEDLKRLFFRLTDRDKIADAVADAVVHNYSKFPAGWAKQLLTRLSEKNSAAYVVASAIAMNFDRLPSDIRDLLDKLQLHLQVMIESLSETKSEMALELLSKAMQKIGVGFTQRMLDILSKDKDKGVRKRAMELKNSTGP